ncbi:MAG: MFS transporter, partial [Acidimicrobiales bacterium]
MSNPEVAAGGREPAGLPDGPPASLRGPKLAVLAICSLSLFLTSLDGTIVNVALPAIQQGLHARIDGLEWVVDAYLLVLASLLLVSGSTGDRIGRRKMFGTGLLIFTAGSLLCSLSPNVQVLIAFRMVQAVGGSMLAPNSLSIITNTFTDSRERAMALGVWSGVFGVSAACGPVLGGLLVVGIGWRSVFWVTAPVGALALVLSRRFVPESRAERWRPIDAPGQVVMAAFLACLTYAIIEAPSSGWGSTRILTLFALSAALLCAFCVIERRARAPLLDLRFFRSPPFSGAVVIAVGCFFVFAGFLFLNTLYLQYARGDSALVAGVMTLPAMCIVALAAPLSGRFVARWGSRGPLAVSGGLITVAALVLMTTTVTTPYWVLATAYLVLGAGFGLANPPITNAAVSGMPREQAGTAGGVSSAGRQIGSVLGVALMGALTTSRYLGGIGGALDRAGIAPAARRVLVAAGPAVVSRSSSGHHGAWGLAGRASEVARATFAVSAHAGWELAAVCGVVVVAAAL